MSESIYMAFAVSVLRSLLLMAGAWLVHRGLVDDAQMREVAAGLALIFVTQGWAFFRIHQRRLFEAWLLALGIAETPSTNPAVAAQVRADAKAMTREGLRPEGGL